MTEAEQIKARLAEIEKAIASAAWAAHMGSARYRPVPGAFYEERRQLQERLQNISCVGLDTL